MKVKLCDLSEKFTTGCETTLGYITPGHGMKGKQVKLSTDDELVNMYDTHKKKKRILLWLKCKSKSTTKRVFESDKGDLPQNKRQASLLTMMNEVDTIVTKLRDIHGKKFTPVQLNCWAHMINTSKHDSFDIPPNKPFFGKKSGGDTVGIIIS